MKVFALLEKCCKTEIKSGDQKQLYKCGETEKPNEQVNLKQKICIVKIVVTKLKKMHLPV